jgi:hypothetical protein
MRKSAIDGGTPQNLEWGGHLIPAPEAIFPDWAVKQSKLGAYGALSAVAVRVPFNTRVVVDSGEATAGYVGTGKAIPLAKLSLDGSTQLPLLKVALAIAFTKELMKSWSPATQRNLDDRLTTATVRGLDAALLDPSVAAVTDESPASLLNGISQLSSAGTSAANMATNISTLAQAHLDGGADPSRLIFVCHPQSGLAGRPPSVP